MPSDPAARCIAVIGMGPRGLGALEALATRWPETAGVLGVDVFEADAVPGAGPNFDPDETPLCLLNTPLRDIDIPPPAFSHVGSFDMRLDAPADPDSFPTRAEIGRYLQERFEDLSAFARFDLRLIPARVERLQAGDSGWELVGDRGSHGPYAAVLLATGQPPVAADDQWARWQGHVARGMGELAQAYPAKQLIAAAEGWQGRTVAIRGMGLSAFDVLRALTVAQGGAFFDGQYLPSGREPARILPFSLDGMPPYPKPETGALDARFAAKVAETRIFDAAMAEASQSTPYTARRLINAALITPVTRILREAGEEEEAARVADWLEAEWDAPGSQETTGPVDTLRHGIAMAEGATVPSIGYAVGQVWRRWQNHLRAGFNPVSPPGETSELIVGFDEGLKRYSYGPPIGSAREWLALADAGLVDMRLAIDPAFALSETGWEMTCGAEEAQVDVMIDAVLPDPDISIVTAPLIRSLRDAGVMVPVAEGLGAQTLSDGALVGAEGAAQEGLCLLGRLALGSVIAADSLHDCLGAAADRWAEGVIDVLLGETEEVCDLAR
ncbi:FAD/NAD(P)-binding protein [Marinovum sp.]|uniref:FAD/NAD(P)-binding protein n=1 Tax=Marinovum sp. TaxID=2024839 RepID=UPI002B275BA5|nr:FAD/NAD(P)-binding protein [Marinovum sp.]